MQKINHLIRLLILVVTILILPATPASAALARCRVDPIFVLSNGDVVTVTVDVFADPSRVHNVIYILHVPTGITVKEVVHTARGHRIKEIYKVYQNSPDRTYVTDTVVTTQNTTTAVGVIAYTRLNGVTTRSASGYNGQHLVVTISRTHN
jgi:hypothetical protein